MRKEKFRFEDLEIWKRGIELNDEIFDLSDELSKRNYFRFGEQLRSASLSIINNIAEGSGSNSKREFILFLNYSRRSVYEVSNMIIVLKRRNLISNDKSEDFLNKLVEISKMITGFKKALS
jgi:four helix bundle protein